MKFEHVSNTSNVFEDSKNFLKFSNIKPLDVIQPYNPQIIKFETPEDFNVYYSKHLDEFNDSTYKLNVKYKIPGYRITKLKGDLKLIKDYRNSAACRDDPAFMEVWAKLDHLDSNLSLLAAQIDNINRYLKSND